MSSFYFCAWLLLVAAISGCNQALPAEVAKQCFERSGQDFRKVLNCYQTAQPPALQYSFLGSTSFVDVEKRRFELISQSWSGHDNVSPSHWIHSVDIYIPQSALHRQALLLVNNGINVPTLGYPLREPTDFSEEMALSIARQTQTIVVSINNVPNQSLTYSDDGLPRREADSMAHSWQLFLQQPQARAFQSLHLPMIQAVIKAMDLQELQAWQVVQFIATGSAERGWAVWSSALSDPRISAIVPFAGDFLNARAVWRHTFEVYAKSWPQGLAAYHQQGIMQQIHTPAFTELLQLHDPQHQAQPVNPERRNIPKYLVHASSDERWVPDSSRFYFEDLPGEKMLRVAPNVGHETLKFFFESALVAFTRRLQQRRPLPWLKLDVQGEPDGLTWNIHFSEPPVRVVQWRAHNPVGRDFRLACGLRYQAEDVKMSQQQSLTAKLNHPVSGWSATYLEATLADGLVITTQVQVLPDTYPPVGPEQQGMACGVRQGNHDQK